MSYEVQILQPEQEALFELRGSAAAIDLLFENLGIVTPVQQGKVVTFNLLEALRIGPRRSLLKTLLGNENTLANTLAPLSDHDDISSVNVSDMYNGMKIVGKDASAVLSQATSLNLYKFQSGFVAATEVFALAAIILRDGTDEFSVYIERSYAAYVWNRLSLCALQEQHVSSF